MIKLFRNNSSKGSKTGEEKKRGRPKSKKATKVKKEETEEENKCAGKKRPRRSCTLDSDFDNEEQAKEEKLDLEDPKVLIELKSK